MNLFSKSASLGLVAGALGLLLGLSPLGLFLEERFGLEILFSLRGARGAPRDVAVVSIDKESSTALGLSDDFRKWPRSVHGRLIDTLHRQGAAAIVFDMVFEEPRAAEEDKAFVDAVRRAGNVILCCYLRTERVPLGAGEGRPEGDVRLTKLVPPMLPLGDAAAAVAPFPLPKVPARVSQYWTFKAGAGDTPTLPVVALQFFAMDRYGEFAALLKKGRAEGAGSPGAAPVPGKEVQNVDALARELRDLFVRDPLLAERMSSELERSRLRERDREAYLKLRSLIAMYSAPNSLYLNFYGPPRTVPTIAYHEALRSARTDTEGGQLFTPKGKAVFVGHAPRFQHDQVEGFLTVFSRPDGLDIAGVEIAATAFANLLEGATLKPVDNAAHIVILFFWGLGVAVFALLLPAGYAAGALIAAGLLYLGIAEYRFAASSSWYPLIVPLFFQLPFALLASFLWRYVDTTRERANIKRALGLYVPKEVVNRLSGSVWRPEETRQELFGICLFADAEGFTTFSEDNEPGEVYDFMNRYFQIVFEPVKRHGGVISNVVGDSVLAIWTATQPDADLRRKACTAAIDIAEAIAEANRSASSFLPTRIGLHSGRIALGNVGAIDHFEYRPIGDIVNTATRIEGINKQLGTRLLASAEVVEGIEGLLTREVGDFLAVGKSHPVALYELICRAERATAAQLEGCRLFAGGLKAYRRQALEEALSLFAEAAGSLGDDRLTAFYIERCRRHLADPSAEPWEGTIRMSMK